MTSGLELHEASSVGDYDTLEDYLKSGKYDVNLQDPEWKNKTPLHWAAARGYVDCLRLLLEYGANGTSRMDMGWTPAHCAAEAGRLTVIRTLQGAGVPVDKKDKYGDTPRRIAEIYGHKDIVNFFILAEQEQNTKKLVNNESDADTQSEEDEEDEEETAGKKCEQKTKQN